MIVYRLITKEWITFFIGTLIILFLLLSVSNLVAGLLRTNVTFREILLNHFIETPRYLKLLIPISCLSASFFSLDKLKGQNELVAIFASGYSRRQLISYVFVISLAVALAQLLISGYVDPFIRANRDRIMQDGSKKFRNLKRQGLSAGTIVSGKIWYRSNDYFISFLTFDDIKNTLSNASLYYFTKHGKMFKKLEIDSLSHLEGNFWRGTGVTEYLFLDEPAIFPSVKKYSQRHLEFNETPEDFVQIKADISTITIVKLYRYIKKLESTQINANRYMILFLNNFSNATLSILFAILAMFSIFTPSRKAGFFGKHLVFILAFITLYWFVSTYFSELGKTSKLNPYLACFGSQILLVFYMSFFFYKNRNLS